MLPRLSFYQRLKSQGMKHQKQRRQLLLRQGKDYWLNSLWEAIRSIVDAKETDNLPYLPVTQMVFRAIETPRDTLLRQVEAERSLMKARRKEKAN